MKHTDEIDRVGKWLRKQSRRWTKFASVFVVLLVVGVVAAVALFAHTFPVYTPPTGVITSACADGPLVMKAQDTSNGWVTFDCGTGTPAFTAVGGTATVTLTAFGAAGYLNLYITQGTPTTSCTAGVTTSKQLNPGPTTLTFATNPPTGSYNYCASFDDLVPKLSFSVTWSQ